MIQIIRLLNEDEDLVFCMINLDMVLNTIERMVKENELIG